MAPAAVLHSFGVTLDDTTATPAGSWRGWRQAMRIVLVPVHLKRSAATAVIVGTILFAINQLNVVIDGQASAVLDQDGRDLSGALRGSQRRNPYRHTAQLTSSRSACRVTPCYLSVPMRETPASARPPEAEPGVLTTQSASSIWAR